MNQQLLKEFQLGDCLVNPRDGRVTGPAGRIRLSPRSLEVLLCLAESPGDLFSREVLIERIWQNRASGNSALTHCISELRHALDDHADDPSYIQTVPRSGYRLVQHPVRPVANLVEPAVASKDGHSGGSTLVAQLRDRQVFRVASIYLIVAWFVTQVAEATFEVLWIPSWAHTGLIVLLIIGFPLAIVLAWAYELTPQGMQRDLRGADRRRSGEMMFLGLVVLVLGLLGFWLATYVADRQQEEESTSPEPSTAEVLAQAPANSVAVLPFANLSDDSDSTYFGDGLADEIISRLTRLNSLQVASRRSSFSYRKADSLDVRTIAARLGVRYVLGGSVQRDGERFRVIAWLTDATTGFQEWAQNYDRLWQDVLRIQRDIALSVARELDSRLTEARVAAELRDPTQSIDAFELYLKGRSLLYGPASENALTKAREAFARAIALDPDYAEAHAGLCDTQLARYELSASMNEYRAAESSCEGALSLDPDAAPVHVALGNLYRISGDYESAAAQFQAAIKFDSLGFDARLGLAETRFRQGRPEQAEALFRGIIERQPLFWRGHQEFGNFLLASGRFAEAIASYRRLVELTPTSAFAFNSLGAAHFMLGDFDAATDAWRRSLELAPNSATYSNLGTALFYSGDFAAAASMYKRANELAPADFRLWGNLGDAHYSVGDRLSDKSEAAYRQAIDLATRRLTVNASDADASAALGHYYARLGNFSKANWYIDQAVSLAPADMVVRYDQALAYATMNEPERALEALVKALALGYPRSTVAVDAGLRSLAKNARFQKILHQSMQVQ